MEVITFDMFNLAKAAEIAKAFDSVREAYKGRVEILFHLVCQGLAFPGQPSDKMVSITLAKVEDHRALSAAEYDMALAGGTLWSVPVLGFDVSKSAVTQLESLRSG